MAPPLTPRLFIQPRRMTEDEYATARGKRRAWRHLWLYDHGVLRLAYDNTHALSDKMWRTYQPSPGRIDEWATMGVKTIINLRGVRDGDRQAGFYWHEKAAAARHGITLIDHRAFSREAPSPDFINFLDDAFSTIAYPAIMHCKSGADRVGIASVLYLFLHEGRPLDGALQHLTWRYGHIPHGKTGILDHFFDTYRAVADADGVTPNRAHFLAWVNSSYDHKALQAAYRPAKLATLLTDHLLRRE